jgi:hypothetical protein
MTARYYAATCEARLCVTAATATATQSFTRMDIEDAAVELERRMRVRGRDEG